MNLRKIFTELFQKPTGRLILFLVAGALVLAFVFSGKPRSSGQPIKTELPAQATAATHKEFVEKLFPEIGDVAFEAEWYGKIGMTADNLPRFHRLAENVVGFSGYNGRGIAPGTVFGRTLAELVSGRITEADLPLPVTDPEAQSLRAVREGYYELGAQLAHLAGARF